MQKTSFHNKENTVIPSTPRKNHVSPKKSKGVRVPLGGKDTNNVTQNVDDSNHNIKPVHRLRKLRGASPKLVNRKQMKVLPDVSTLNEVISKGEEEGDDYELEYRSIPQPELPYIPLNYTPVTQDDLNNLSASPLKRPFKALCEDEDNDNNNDNNNDNDNDHNDDSDEFPLNFESDEEMEQIEARDDDNGRIPHFMKATVGSKLKAKEKMDIYHDGLTNAELHRLVDEQ